MKSKILLLGAALFCTVASQAQRIQIGPEVGLNISNVHIDDDVFDEPDTDPRLGLKIGGIVDIGFTPMVSFQPGLFFSAKGFKSQYENTFSDGGTLYVEEVENNYRINYLEIPMNFQFSFGSPYRSRFFFGAGPYLGFAIGGDVDYEHRIYFANGAGALVDTYDDERDLEIGDNELRDDVKGMDAGLNLNMGFMGRKGFFLRGNFGLGLANISPLDDDDYEVKNRGFSITAGMLFGH